jgi:tRNA-dihydrouridine synthase B
MKNFWQDLKTKSQKPFFVIAPMADVTDAAFRRIFAKYGKPDVTWTEFVSADGLIRATEIGKKKLLKDLLYTDAERPIVAQLFSANPEMMAAAARLVEHLGFDGLDINMGCPDRGVEKQGAGAALIKNPKRAREVIRAAKQGAPNIPVSVKTRLGYDSDELETWLPELLAENPAVITIHARTRKEMSLVPARWERVKRAVEIRDEIQKNRKDKTLIFGNGDVEGIDDAKIKVAESGADGAMLGRAIFGNPWVFTGTIPTIDQKLLVMLEHTELFEELLGDVKNFAVMKKHYKAYVQGFEGAAELRARLMETKNAAEVQTIVHAWLETHQLDKSR